MRLAPISPGRSSPCARLWRRRSGERAAIRCLLRWRPEFHRPPRRIARTRRAPQRHPVCRYWRRASGDVPFRRTGRWVAAGHQVPPADAGLKRQGRAAAQVSRRRVSQQPNLAQSRVWVQGVLGQVEATANGPLLGRPGLDSGRVGCGPEGGAANRNRRWRVAP
ncbi:MAG: hypothetical protein GY820_10005 [Gammaproteobacteria bacterium]|nr:hypothetical protein [Gammaproteobacteria bacterium]